MNKKKVQVNESDMSNINDISEKEGDTEKDTEIFNMATLIVSFFFICLTISFVLGCFIGQIIK